MHEENQIPIWFFIGGLLLIYGIIIFATGLYLWACPPAHPVEMFDKHPDVWWGVLLTVLGTFYTVRYAPWRRRNE
jgi:hypothetical protein